MRLLVISDLHGDFQAAWKAVDATHPDVLLSCGDWGDPGEVEQAELDALTQRLPVYTVFGNHDPLELLEAWTNQDGSPVLLTNGEVQRLGSLTLAGINGIWAKSHRKPYYITDEEVDAAAQQISSRGLAVDLLLSHGCPSGMADLTWQNRHGGQRCFLRAFQLLRPSVYLTGHLHRAQEYRTRDGQIVRNVGSTPNGDAVLLEWNGNRLSVSALRL